MENADEFYNHQYPISSFLQHIVTKIVTTLPWANVFIVNLCIELLQYIAVVRFFSPFFFNHMASEGWAGRNPIFEIDIIFTE